MVLFVLSSPKKFHHFTQSFFPPKKAGSTPRNSYEFLSAATHLKIYESPLKRDHFRRKFHLPTINLQGGMLFFREVIFDVSWFRILGTPESPRFIARSLPQASAANGHIQIQKFCMLYTHQNENTPPPGPGYSRPYDLGVLRDNDVTKAMWGPFNSHYGKVHSTNDLKTTSKKQTQHPPEN